MSCWTKEQLENMLEDVVNELDLSDEMIELHGPLATPPAQLVKIILARKDMEISLLKRGFICIEGNTFIEATKKAIEFTETTGKLDVDTDGEGD